MSIINITDIAAWCEIVYEGNHSNPLGYAHRLFFNNQEIINLQIPNTIKSIGAAKFYKLANLKSVNIPESVISIGANAFYGCTGLTSITIPKSVSYIGYGALNGCTSLNSVYFNAVNCDNFNYKNPPYTGEDFYPPFYDCPINNLVIGSSVKKIPSRLAWKLSALKSVNIPNSVDSIMGSAFVGCSGLTSVTIGNSVISIGVSAFGGCRGLTSVTIPNSVTSIGSSVFSGCTGLTSVSIGNSVTAIDKSTFYDCSALTSLVIGKSVRTIDATAFSNCTSLKSLYFNAEACNDFQMKNNIYPPFYGLPLEMISIGDGVKRIPSNFARGITQIKNIAIPNSVTIIGEYAFGGCSGLMSVTIPNSVTSIGGYAFAGCSGLENVTINDICSWLNITFTNYSSNPLCNSARFFLEGTELTELNIPESVTKINEYAFNIQLGVKSTHFNASTLVSINLVTEDVQNDISGWVTKGEDENFIFMRG